MPERKPHSIRDQLVILVAVVALPLTALAAVSIILDFQTGIAVAAARAEGLAGATASSVNQFLANADQSLAALAADPRVVSSNPDVCRAAIAPTAKAMPQFQPVLVVDTTGTVVCAGVDPGPMARVMGDRRWFKDALTSDRFTIGDPVIGRITQRSVVALSRLVRDQAGVPQRVVALPADKDALEDLLRSVPVPEGTIITLADLEGVVVARTFDPDHWIGKKLPDNPEVKAELGRLAHGVSRTKDGEGVDRVFAWSQVGRHRWVVFVGIPEGVALKSAYAGLLAKLIVALFIAAISAVMVHRVYLRITGALSDVVEQTKAAVGADPKPIPETGPTEIAAVARQFNQTLAARVRAEEETARANERYRSIVHTAVFGIYVAQPDGTILEGNPALATLLSIDSPNRLAGISERALYLDHAAWEREVQRTLEVGSSGPVEVEWRRPDGKILTMRIFRNAFRGSDGSASLEVIAEDLTERRSLEEQTRWAQRMEAVGRLAGGVAHDFNNRLTVMMAYAQLLQDSVAEEDPLREYADQIVHAAKGAKSLTTQLLAFGRKDVIRPRLIDMNDVVSRFTGMLPIVLGEGIAVRTELADGSMLIFADPSQLEQILLNLVLNARDAMPNGGTITIETRDRTVSAAEARSRLEIAAGRYRSLRVTDTGVGMEESVRDRVFEPFFTTKPTGQGTGLGLSTVFGLVRQHEGHVLIESAPGTGTKVEVLLPMPTRGEIEAASADEGAQTRGRATILVAEDDDEVRRAVVRIVERGGHRVIAARDGAEAIALLEQRGSEVDLLLTDIVMPGLRGTAVADRFQAMLPGRPVLFVSGYSNDPPPLDVRTGLRGLVRKPVEVGVLLAAVADLLARSRAGGLGPGQVEASQ